LNHKYRKLVLLLLLAVTPVALAADRERVKEVGQHLMCICGCTQVLTTCNMVSCPSRGGLTQDLSEQIDLGKSEGSILDYFAQKYGLAVLSAPPASGFNLSAWITPFLALAIGAMMVVYFARRFKARWTGTPASANPNAADYQQRIEDELKKYIPED